LAAEGATDVKILFVAKHGNHDNADEDAVSFALEQLGHTVIRVQEYRRLREDSRPIEEWIDTVEADLCLCFKWETVSEMIEVAQRMPLCFWYFDLVSSECPTLAARMQTRRNWMRDVVPNCKVGFCTDGDWVESFNVEHYERVAGPLGLRRTECHDALVHLMQGADERVAGFGERNTSCPPIIFTGMIHHGARRAEHVSHLQAKWGDRFAVIGNRGPLGRRHGRELADLFASTSIVVAPDGPVTDSYWSNRLWLSLSLGAFLLHPYCAKIADYYRIGEEVICYRSREELDDLIGYYLDRPQKREEIRMAGFKATIDRNLYRHRVAELIAEVERRL
jgi:hypothetical protein